jgi:hypothetical protein
MGYLHTLQLETMQINLSNKMCAVNEDLSSTMLFPKKRQTRRSSTLLPPKKVETRCIMKKDTEMNNKTGSSQSSITSQLFQFAKPFGNR